MERLTQLKEMLTKTELELSKLRSEFLQLTGWSQSRNYPDQVCRWSKQFQEKLLLCCHTAEEACNIERYYALREDESVDLNANDSKDLNNRYQM